MRTGAVGSEQIDDVVRAALRARRRAARLEAGQIGRGVQERVERLLLHVLLLWGGGGEGREEMVSIRRFELDSWHQKVGIRSLNWVANHPEVLRSIEAPKLWTLHVF